MALTSTQLKRQLIEKHFSAEMAKRQSILDFDNDGYNRPKIYPVRGSSIALSKVFPIVY